MTQAGQTHAVNLTMLHPRKISFDFNPVVSPPCVFYHTRKGKNLSPKRTLWISSDHRDLLLRYSGCLSFAALAEGLAGTRVWFGVDFSRAFREVPKFSVTFGVALLCSGTGAAAYLKQQILTAPQFSVFCNYVFERVDLRESSLSSILR